MCWPQKKEGWIFLLSVMSGRELLLVGRLKVQSFRVRLTRRPYSPSWIELPAFGFLSGARELPR